MKENRIALITEADNGLGYQFASILKKQGFEVIIAAKKHAHLNLHELDLEGIQFIETDLTQTKGVTQLYSFIKTVYGKLDVLINNAEIANGFGQKITDLDMDEVKKLYDENLFSVMHLTKTLFELLNKSKNAIVMNITSGLGCIDKMKDQNFDYSSYKITAYSTAKAALDMFTLILQREFESTNINVKSFDPIRPKNCTHNQVTLCPDVEKEFLGLLQIESFAATN